MNLAKKPLSIWLKDVITLVIGILLIITGATGKGGYTDAISYIIGITLIVVGACCVLFALYVGIKTRKGFILLGAPGTVMVLLGISLVVNLWATFIIAYILVVIPYLVLAVGFVLIIDAIMRSIFEFKENKKSFLIMLPQLILGAVSLILGVLCLIVNKDGEPIISTNVQLIVLGIIVTLNAISSFSLTVVNKPTVVEVIEEDK